MMVCRRGTRTRSNNRPASARYLVSQRDSSDAWALYAEGEQDPWPCRREGRSKWPSIQRKAHQITQPNAANAANARAAKVEEACPVMLPWQGGLGR